MSRSASSTRATTPHRRGGRAWLISTPSFAPPPSSAPSLASAIAEGRRRVTHAHVQTRHATLGEVLDQGQALVWAMVDQLEPVRRPTQHPESPNRIALASVRHGDDSSRHVWAESHAERDVLSVLEWAGARIVTQPTRLSLILSDRTAVVHVPDALIEHHGRRALIDVRHQEGWTVKFAIQVAATHAWAASRGLDYWVATPPTRVVAGNLARVAQATRVPEPAQALGWATRAGLTQPLSIQQLSEVTSDRNQLFLACLWLLAHHHAQVELTLPLNHSSVLRAGTGHGPPLAELAGLGMLHRPSDVLETAARRRSVGSEPT